MNVSFEPQLALCFFQHSLFQTVFLFSSFIPSICLETVSAVVPNKTDTCSRHARRKAIARASEHESTTFLPAINPIVSLAAHLPASPPRGAFASRPFSVTLQRASPCQTLLSSRFFLPLIAATVLPVTPSTPPPLPQYLREEATCGPSGESADSCVHTLSGGLQLFTHFSLLPFRSSPSSRCPPPSLPLPLCCLFTPRWRVGPSPSLLFPPSSPSFPCFSSTCPLIIPAGRLQLSDPLLRPSLRHFLTSTASAQQLLTSTSLTNSVFPFCLLMSPSF